MIPIFLILWTLFLLSPGCGVKTLPVAPEDSLEPPLYRYEKKQTRRPQGQSEVPDDESQPDAR